MGRILAISDIHGEIGLFNTILNKINYLPNKDQLILLGDYIDRGPRSADVLEKVIQLHNEGAIVLRGNHDQMMVNAAHGGKEEWNYWQRNGGNITVASYGHQMTRDKLFKNKLFQKHITFIETLKYYYVHDQFVFAHAGIDPKRPLSETDRDTFLWIREPFLSEYSGNKVVVVGHTRTVYLHDDPNNCDIYFGENNIVGIDGGAVFGGQLNCYDVTNNVTYNVRVPD